MNKRFEEPMINVYTFRKHDIATEELSGYGGNGGDTDLGDQTDIFRSNYITVQGTFDENVPL